LPVVGWARAYQARNLRFDLLAGVTLAAFAVPESLAYASLAAVPPQVGLYAAIAAMLTYAVFGSSRVLATGVTSALAVLTAGTVGRLAGGDPGRAAAMAAFAALVAGAAALAGWLCRLGFLANLVSRSVLTGFSAGAGLYIASTQLPKLFGVEGAEGGFFDRMGGFFEHVGAMRWPTLAAGGAALLLLVAGKKIAPRLPSTLLVVALALVLAPVLDLARHGVTVVGEIPRGLPAPGFPADALGAWRSLLPLGLSIFVLSYVEGVSAARSLAAKHGGHVDPNQELLANAAGNLVSGLFHGMAVGGSLTRSSVNVEVGARTPLSGAIGGALLLVVVALLTGVFRNLPETVLAAIILMAVAELVDVRALRRTFDLSKREAAIAFLSALGVLLFGVLWGVVIGVAASLLDLLERATFPHTAVLGRVPGTDEYADLELHPENQPVEGVLALRVDASVVFANAHTVKEDVLEQVRRHAEPVRLLVLDLESSPLLDLSGAGMLDELRAALEAEGITVKLAGAKAAARDLLRAEAPERFADLEPGLDVGRAVRAWLSQHPRHA
jgi:high affinity sulfate transporter 1